MLRDRRDSPTRGGRIVSSVAMAGALALVCLAGLSPGAGAAGSGAARSGRGATAVMPLPPRLLGRGPLVSGGQSSFSPAPSLIAPAVAAQPWTLVTSPNLTSQDSLNGVACAASDDCWAVGNAVSEGAQGVLIEHNTGDGWGIVPSPALPSGLVASSLSGVSCLSGSDCWAVGDAFTNLGVEWSLLEQYDGTAWSVSDVEAFGGLQASLLFGIACVAGHCWSVGEGYNGASWQPLVLEDGVFVSTPPISGLGALFYDACVSATDCWAVGNVYPSTLATSSTSLIEHWDGTSWTTVSLAAVSPFDILGAVTCTAIDNCWADGIWTNASHYFQTLIEHWDGTSWTQAPSPSPGDGDVLNGIACASATVCWAVGVQFPTLSNVPDQTLIEEDAGSGWSVVSSPNTSSTVDNQLYGVTCDGSVNCWAVGEDIPSIDTTSLQCIVCRTLIEQSVQASAPPLVTGLTPAAGPVGGGQVVTVEGYGFPTDGSLTATLGGIAVTPGSVTPTSFTFTTPRGSAGHVTLVATDGNGSSPADANAGYLYVGLSSYVPLTPFRLLDTRTSSCVQCAATSTLLPAETEALQVTGYTDPSSGESVPTTATAVVLNVTAVMGTAGSYISLYPTGTGRPNASNLNFSARAIIANLVTTTIGAGGQVELYNSVGVVNVVVDVEGYFAAPSGVSGGFHAIPPLRVCDTRLSQVANPCNGNGTASGALGPGQAMKVDVTAVTSGAGDIPGDGTAEAAVLNLTAVGRGPLGTYLSVYPTDSSGSCVVPPPSSTINVAPRTIEANRVFVSLGPATTGAAATDVCVYNSLGTIDFILDANGWFGSSTAAAGTLYQAIGPSRICDTRSGTGTECSGQSLTQGGVETVQVTGVGGVPALGPLAMVANLTAVAGSRGTFLTIYPADSATTPNASDLNVSGGQILPNLVVVKLATASPVGAVDIYNSLGTINVIVDVEGWFVPPV